MVGMPSMRRMPERFPIIMGVLNRTPDSFSDGGKYASLDRALWKAEEMVRDGAAIVDVGGESTRPGAPPVSAEEEIERTIPVIEALVRRVDARLSIDTQKYEVALAAVKAGAAILNDVSAARDPRLIELAAQYPIDVILMHMQGSPEEMQKSPDYPNGVVEEVREFLRERVQAFQAAGVKKDRLWIDPGIGFGKTLAHNLELLNRLSEFHDVAERVVIGTSRKSFLAGVMGSPALPFEAREAGTLASNLWAYQKGASVFRVHDVGAMNRALKTWGAIERCY